MAKKLGPTEYYKTEYRASTPDAQGFRYSADGKRLLRAPGKIKDYTIPEGVESICDGAFKGRVTYTTIILPSTLKYIGSFAFYGCRNLKKLTPTDSIISVGEYALGGTQVESSIFSPTCNIKETTFSEITSKERKFEERFANPLREYYKPKHIFDRNIWIFLFGILLVVLYIIIMDKIHAFGILLITVPIIIWIIVREILAPYKTAKRFSRITGIAFPPLLILEADEGYESNHYYAKFIKPINSAFIKHLANWSKKDIEYSNSFWHVPNNFYITIDVEKSLVIEYQSHFG